jgi:RNA polymerase sigma-70 factor (ECF subfamily)
MSDIRVSDIRAGAPPDTATRAFVDHRELLFSIVYNMLGGIADTEDVLQETWLAWAVRNRGPDARPVDHPRAYLVRIAVNQALARRQAISRRRETYIGPWLPEPLVTPLTDAAERSESVSLALLVVLESLTPLERVVFVLHEVFGYAHTETAGILGRSPSAVRQLAHRAREHVNARRPRFRADARQRRELHERFITAVRGGDLDALLEILAPDVTLWADGGGKARAAGRRPLRGRDHIAKVLAAAHRRPIPGLRVDYRLVNGDFSLMLLSHETPFSVIVLDPTPEGDRVRGVYSITNPEKLARVG